MKHSVLVVGLLSVCTLLSPCLSPAADTASADQSRQAKRDPKRFRNFFRPFRVDQAVISPDGRHLAFTQREEDKLYVITCEIDHPEVAKAKVLVADDEGATPMMATSQSEKTPALVTWMRWVNSNRLVLETNRVTARFDSGWQDWRGEVFAFNADGGEARSLVKPADVPELLSEVDNDPALSVNRADNPVDARVRRPDRLEVVDPDAVAVPETAATPRAQAFAPETVTNIPSTPRSLRVFATDPQRPDTVQLVLSGVPRSRGVRMHEFVSLDVMTGKITSRSNEFVATYRDSMIDQNGVVRLTVPNNSVASFPHRYEYFEPAGRNFERDLEKYLGGAVGGFSISPENFFGERSIPLGFDRNPNVLYYASNVGRDKFGLYSLDLAKKARGSLAVESPLFDLIGVPTSGFPGRDVLVFDPHTQEVVGFRYEAETHTTRWIRPEWQQIQSNLEKQFLGQIVEITDWDTAGRRLVVTVQGPANAGAVYIFDREKNRLSEFARRAPWMAADHSHATLPFGFKLAEGAEVTGWVTIPRQPRVMPAPLLVYLAQAPWQRAGSRFQTEIQALADMGFVIAQINARGAWGFGRAHREAIRGGYDELQVSDLATAVGKIVERFKVNPARVAVLGFDHGGFIALRALQLRPDVFRCGVVIDAPIDLGAWLSERHWANSDVQAELTRRWFGDEAHLAANPLFKSSAVPTKPLLFLHYPGPDGGTRSRSYLDARAYARKLAKAGTEVEFKDLSADYARGLPQARADVFAQIEDFLNYAIYDYSAKLGELHELK